MVIAGIPLNVLTVIVPSILLVIGSAEDLHMMHEYLEGIEETNGDRDGSIKLMSSKLGLAVLMTSITTVVGFASIMYNDISMLIQFGQVATFALIANSLATFTFGPALLHFFGPTKVRKHETKVHFIDGLFKGIANGTLALVNNPRRKVIIVVTLSLLTAAMLGATFLVKVNNDFMGYFKADSEIRKRSDTLHKELAGAQTFFIRINSGMPDTFKQSEYLSQVAALQQFMAQKGWFDKTESLADRVALIHREMNKGDKQFFAIPADSNLVSQYMLFFQRDEISRFVSPDFSEVSIMVRHNVSASYEITAILEELQKYMKKNMNPNFKFDVTGEYILINKAAESLAINSVTSLALTLFIVFLCMYFLFWSFKAGMISLVPNIFPIVSIYGIMGLLDIPLNVGTAMVADIAIGIAVDDTIHFMNRYQQAMQELQDSHAAVAVAVHDEVRPVVCSSIALAGGFAICAISQFIPVIQFGLLSAAVMIIAIIGELLITPILLQSTQLITLWDMIGLKLQDAVVKRAPFFDGLRPWSRRKVCLLGRMNEKNTGELAVVQGEMGKSMYLLLEGKADVIGHDEATKKDIIFATLNPGDIFGEIALVSPGPRSANVKATEPIRYLEIDWEGLKRIQKIYPRIGGQLFLNLSRILGERLIHTNLMLFNKA
jgi:predicted RND superfamily exporter protein